MSSRTSTWSIWLCGRCAGYVRPRTARRQPGSSRTTPRTPEVAVARDDRGPSGRRQLRPQRAQVAHRREPPQLRRRRAAPTTSTSVPVDVDRAQQRRTRAVRIAADRARSAASRRASDREARADTRAPTCPSPGTACRRAARPLIVERREVDRLDAVAVVAQRRRARRARRASRHDSSTTTTSASKPRTTARDVEPVAVRPRRSGRPPSGR